MRKEYDFSKGIRGVHAARYGAGVKVVLTEEDGAPAKSVSKRDTQLTELAGRHFVIAQLTAGGVEVAIPVRDRGVDLIAYVDVGGTAQRFVACPIQLKVHTGRRFSLDKKYDRIRNLLLTYVWHIDEPQHSRVFAMTYPEALDILRKKGYDQSQSWIEGGSYSVSSPDPILLGLLEPYSMNPQAWAKRIASSVNEVVRKTA